MSTLDFVLRLLAACGFGIVIGFERQFSRQMAGIRTNALVCLGACLFTMMPFRIGASGDVYRIAAAVVTGVGFLGGGVIVRDGFTIKGLTTAATMWCTSAVGVTVACGYFVEAGIATVLILLTNLLLHPLSEKVKTMRAPHPSHAYQYRIIVACGQEDALRLRASLGSMAEGSRLQLLALETLPSVVIGSIRLMLLLQADQEDRREIERLMTGALSQVGVLSASWETVSEEDR